MVRWGLYIHCRDVRQQRLALNLKAASDYAENVVKAATEKLSNALGSCTYVFGDVLMGSPKWAIIEEANRWGADLIVLGAHGDGFLEGFVIGSIAPAAICMRVARSNRAPSACWERTPRPPRGRSWNQSLSGLRSTKSHEIPENTKFSCRFMCFRGSSFTEDATQLWGTKSLAICNLSLNQAS
jgi:hypothetical protein